MSVVQFMNLDFKKIHKGGTKTDTKSLWRFWFFTKCPLRNTLLWVHCGSGWWRLLKQVRQRGTQLKEAITYTFQPFNRTGDWSKRFLTSNMACLHVQPCCCRFVLIWKETSYQQCKLLLQGSTENWQNIIMVSSHTHRSGHCSTAGGRRLNLEDFT